MTEREMRIPRRFFKDEVYDRIRRLIVTGELRPDEKLNIQVLSDQLGVSRTPVREALLRLELDGLVVSKANSWTQVAPMDKKEAQDIYPVVWALETMALRLAFDRIGPKEIDELERINEQLLTMPAGDHTAFPDVDNAFHHKIIELADNRELEQLLDGLKIKLRRIENYYFRQVDVKVTYEEHKNLIRALRENNRPAAFASMERNWETSLEQLLKYL